MGEKNKNLSVVFSPDTSKISDKKKSFWHINRGLLPYKLHYLLLAGGGGAVTPFTPAFGITVLGLTASNIAACFTTQQITLFILKPGIGYMTDYLNRLKAIIVGLAVFKIFFCFIMINIPNSGLPGMRTLESTTTSQNNAKCQLCFNSYLFEHVPEKGHLDEENFRRVSLCFKSNVIQTIFLNCSSEYIKATKSSNNSLKIRQTTCNIPYKDSVLSNRSIDLETIHANTEFLDILYIENSKISSICFLPVGRLFHPVNFSQDVSQFCYAFSNKSTTKLKSLFSKSVFLPVDCSDLHKEILFQQKDERNISFENFKTYQFWMFLVSFLMVTTCSSIEFTMADTACYESIQDVDFGQQKVWGAIGWGLMASFAGFLNDYTKSYLASWCILVCLSVLQIWNLNRMNLIKPDFSQNTVKDLKRVLSSKEFLCFAAGILLNGMLAGIIWYYLTWFVISIGGNKLNIGLIHAFQCFFGEVPAFYFSGWLLKKLGHFNLVSLALISHGIRFFCYSYLYNPWWVLPIECLHGFTYGSFLTAMTSYAKLNSNPGTEATTQSILCTIYEALGFGLGCSITGVCLEYFEGHITFFYISIFCIVATMINILSTFVIRYGKLRKKVLTM